MRSFWIDAGRRGAMPLKIVDVVGNQAFERELQNGWGIDLSEFKQIINNAIARHMADVDEYVPPPVDSEIAENKTPGSDYEWSCTTEYGEDDDDDDEDDKDIDEDDSIAPARQPKSIFEDEAYMTKMFGAAPKKEEDEEDDAGPETKNLFVFVANRLTFLAQTVQPIIFDTSHIETGENYITIAVNEDKTFPKIKSFDDLGRIACQINCNQTIRDEIAEFLKGSEWSDIFCFPEFLPKNEPGSDVWALKFICYKDND